MSDKAKNVSAWVLDDTVSVAAEGAALAGIPGLWHQDRPVSPEAFGMTVGEFEQVVKDLDLPLRKVSVKASEALTSFDGLRVNHLESQALGYALGVPDEEAEARSLADGSGTVAATLREAERIEETTPEEAAAGTHVVLEED